MAASIDTILAQGRRASLTGPFAAAEAVAGRDQNNLFLTSCFFRDVHRYEAFCAYYAVMRIVDDRVDDLAGRPLSRRERRREHDVLGAWEEGVREAYKDRAPHSSVLERCDHPHAVDLLAAFGCSLSRFPAPPGLWAEFFRSMRWDLDHDRFETWGDFLAYAEGASVAPTTIYLVLLTADSGSLGGALSVPVGFDLVSCGRHLGTFAYLGHIVRDLAEDLGVGDRGLLYLTREDMAAHGVTEDLLRADLRRGRASVSTRSLVADLLARASRCLGRGRESLAPLAGCIGDDCAFILELIVTMYERVIDKIERCGFDPFSGRHRLSRTEKGAIIREVAGETGFDLTTPNKTPSARDSARSTPS